MSRRSNPDVRSLGRSKIVPHIYGEPPEARHERRKRAALQMESAARIGSEKLGFRLEISNDGHHFRWYDGDRLVAQWWPSSAKLVRGVDFDRGVHAHDIRQVLAQLWSWLRPPKVGRPSRPRVFFDPAQEELG